MSRHRSTHPSDYFERQSDERDARLLHWDNPTWIERNGELIVAMLGAAVLAFAVVVGALALFAGIGS